MLTHGVNRVIYAPGRHTCQHLDQCVEHDDQPTTPGINDPRITLWDIFAGTQPFTLIMFVVLLLIIAFPGIALFFN